MKYLGIYIYIIYIIFQLYNTINTSNQTPMQKLLFKPYHYTCDL